MRRAVGASEPPPGCSVGRSCSWALLESAAARALGDGVREPESRTGPSAYLRYPDEQTHRKATVRHRPRGPIFGPMGSENWPGRRERAGLRCRFRCLPADTGPTLLERDVELSGFTAALASARAGTGRMIVVEGPPGAGKTALLDALAERLAAGDGRAVVRRVRGSELARDRAFGGARELLSGLTDDDEGWPVPRYRPRPCSPPVTRASRRRRRLRCSRGWRRSLRPERRPRRSCCCSMTCSGWTPRPCGSSTSCAGGWAGLPSWSSSPCGQRRSVRVSRRCPRSSPTPRSSSGRCRRSVPRRSPLCSTERIGHAPFARAGRPNVPMRRRATRSRSGS